MGAPGAGAFLPAVGDAGGGERGGMKSSEMIPVSAGTQQISQRAEKLYSLTAQVRSSH